MSDPREAGKLLGGHAAGILTEAERTRLYAAALEDQVLFDALADDEALRELLADPAARARLLQALQPRPARPFWRRPGTLALAAGLIGAAWIGLLRKPEKELADRQAVSELAAPPPPLAKAAPKVLAEPAPGPAQRRAKPPSDKAERIFGYASPAAGPVAPPPPPPPPSAAPAAGNLAVPELDRLPEAKSRMISGTARLAPGVQLSAPSWTFEGTGRLLVTWDLGGSLYLLRRGPEGISVLEPVEEHALPEGRKARRYQVPADGSTLDLYWLPEPTPHPEQLPPKAPSGGTWTRIR